MPDLPCRGGGGVNSTSVARNDTHVALIILTTQMWGGGGGIIGGKNFFGPNFVFLCLWRQHPFLHKTKGPTRNPISPPPPSLLRRASMSAPPQVAQIIVPNGWRESLPSDYNTHPAVHHSATPVPCCLFVSTCYHTAEPPHQNNAVETLTSCKAVNIKTAHQANMK